MLFIQIIVGGLIYLALSALFRVEQFAYIINSSKKVIGKLKNRNASKNEKSNVNDDKASDDTNGHKVSDD